MKLWFTILAVATISAFPTVGHAATLTFDDIDVDGISGFTYHDVRFGTSILASSQGPYLSIADPKVADPTQSGQYNGAVSGHNVLVGTTQGMAFAALPFDEFVLNDLYVTSLTLNPLHTELVLSLDGKLVEVIPFTVTTTAPTLIIVNRLIDEALFRAATYFPENRSSVTLPGFFNNPSVVLDNVRINEAIDGPGPTPVPEPATLALTSAGVLALLLRRRRVRSRESDGVRQRVDL
jgi:hypothetical protein